MVIMWIPLRDVVPEHHQSCRRSHQPPPSV